MDKAYNINTDNRNVICSHFIATEMTDAKVDFKAIEDCEDVPISYTYVLCHMIFDVKKENFS